MAETQIESALSQGPPGTTKAEPGPDGKLQYFNAAGKSLGPAPEPSNSNDEPGTDPYAEFGGSVAPDSAKPAAAVATDPYAEFGGSVAPEKAAADPYAEFGGSVAPEPTASQVPAKPTKPGLVHGLLESVGLPTSKEGFEELVKESPKKGMLSAATLGPIVDVAPAIWDYAKRVGKNIGGDLHEEYEAGRNILEGGPVGANLGKAGSAIVHGAVSNIPFVGEPIQQAGEDILNENYSHAAGELIGAIGQIALPEAHERINAHLAHARELTAAVEDHKAASAVHTNATNEVNIATTQATEAKRLADEAVQKEAAGQGTRDQTVVAQDNASAASANVMKAQEKLKRATEAQAQAAVKVEKSTNQITKQAKPKGPSAEDMAASNKEIMETIPPGPGKSAYTPEDLTTVRPYLDNYHLTKEAVGGPEGVYDAMDHAQQKIETDVAPHVKTYAKEPLLLTDDKGAPTSVKQKLVEALAPNEAVRPGFTEEALAELENYNYTTDPSVAEADALRKQLNTDNRKQQNQDRSDVQTLRDSDPKFAARYELNDILRNGIYDRFEERQVKGIRGKRQDEAAIIRFRNAADRQIPKAEVKQRGTADVSTARDIAGKLAPNVATGLGIAGGAALAGPVGAEIGGFGGRYLGKKLGRILSPEDLTRNERITRAMKVTGEGKVPQIDTSNALPSNPEANESESFEERYGKASRPTPAVDPHEGTPLHGELATHFGETIGDTPYAELERQFREDIATKKKYKVALEPAEKTLLQKLNAQTVQEKLNLKKKPVSTRPTGTANDRPQVPYVPTEKATTMSAPAKDLGPEWNAGAEAHEAERNKAIVRNPDATPEEKAIAQQRLDDQRQRSKDIAAQLAKSLEEAPTDNNLHADLATHYGESLANTDAGELENRFMSDLQAKNAEGTELEPAEKTLLAKINKSKADTRNALRDAAAEAAKAKTEAGQVATTQPPFETEPHRQLPKKWADKGVTADMVALHELGHSLVTAEHGYPVEDLLSHEHPSTRPGAAGMARWNPSEFLDENGKVDFNKVKGGIDKILDIFHGGPVAQDINHGIPIEQNRGAESDLSEMRKFLKASGFTPMEAAQMMKASELRVREMLTTPGVSDIMKRYTQLREKGLDPKYLMSQDALGAAIQEYKNARGGGGNEGIKSGVSGKAGEGDVAGKPGGNGKVPSGRAKEARPAGEAGTGAGSGRRASDLTPEHATKIQHGGIESEPPPERSTGNAEYDKIIKAGGGVPGGFTDFGEHGKIINFHDPRTGSTLGIKEGKPITPEAVRDQITKKHAEYGLPPENLNPEMAPASTVKDEENLVGAPQKTLSLKDEQGKEIGNAIMRPSADGKNLQIEVSQLDANRRGEGFGKKMYTDAIQHAKEQGFETVTSDRNRTEDANHVWEALKKDGYPVEQKNGRYSVDLSKIGQIQPRDTFASAADHYGTTEDINKAGFIGPDGRMLDFSDGQKAKTLDHGDISTVTGEKSNPREKFQASSGSMRILHSPRQNYVGLHFDLDHPPTAEQLDRVVPLLKGGTTVEADITSADPTKTAQGTMNVGGHMAEAEDADGLRRVVNDARTNAARKIAVRQNNLNPEMATHDIQGELAKTREESRADRRHGIVNDAMKAFENPTTRAPFRENDLREAADQFNNKNGRPPIETAHVPEDPRSSEVADAYKNAVHAPNDPAVKASYDALKRDIKDQYHLMKQLGIKTDVKPENPYGLSEAVPAHEELHNDIRNNKHLSVWSGGAPPADHPLSAIDPETGHTYNELFRMVHDTFGHAAERTDFSPAGEESAWNLHRQMFSPEARPALATETKGQAAYTYKYGDFPPQKAALLPEEFQRPGGVQQTLKQPEIVKSAQAMADKIGAKVVGSTLTSKTPNDLDLRIDGNYDNAAVEAKLKEVGFEHFGSQLVSPKEAKASGKPFGLGWNRAEYFESPSGAKIEVWHDEPYTSMADVAKRMNTEPAGGVDPRTGKSEATGIGTEIYPEAQQKLDHQPTAADVQKFYDTNKALFDKHPELRLGWSHEPKGWELNIGAVGDNAPEVAKRLNQRAAFDIGKGEEIPTGGTGEAKSFPEYPLEDRLADLKGEEPNFNPEMRDDDRDKQIKEGVKALHFDKIVDDYKNGYKVFDKGEASPHDVENNHGFLLGDGSVLASQDKEGEGYPKSHGSIADELGAEKLKNANAIRIAGPNTFEIYGRPTTDQLSEIGRLAKEESNNSGGERKVVWDFHDGAKNSSPDSLQNLRGNFIDSGEGSIGSFRRAVDAAYSEPNLNPEMATRAKDSTEVSPKGSSVGLRDNPLKIKATGESEKPSTVDVAMALNKFTKKSLPALELNKAEPQEMVDRAKSLMEDEAKYQLAQNNTGEAWYTKDMGKHDEILQSMRPELQDPAKLSLFKMAEAVLSSGQKPYSNFKAAVKAWDHYYEGGQFPPVNPDTNKSWGPRNVAAYGNAMDSINRLVAEKGEQGASDWLLGDHTVKELKEYNKNVSGKADDVQPGVLILGPKRGPFAQNLHGKESAFTADMWVARSWNRWMGTAEIAPDGELYSDRPRSDKERKLMAQSFKETADKLGKSTSSLQAILWYYEQALYDAHGSAKESWNFADAAQRAKDEEDNTFKFGANEPLTNFHAKGIIDALSGKKE